jgi:signal transduction histidine kinase
MKLSNKFILLITGSKLIIVLFFILLLPFLVQKIASDYTNHSLREQKRKVIDHVEKNGADYYLQGDNSYGSYTMLKEEYISLEPVADGLKVDTIKNTVRLIEKDTLNYRVLSYTFKNKNKNYLLEIGKTTASINQYNRSIQRFALYVLVALIVLTILIDLIFTRLLIRPLAKIIKTKLLNRKFPFKDQRVTTKTSTTDFKYLDESITLLMDQINEAFAKEREFTANASHELMTPISILQNKMENLLGDEQMSESVTLGIIGMMKTLDRLKKISGALLLISRIENEQFVKNDDVKVLILFNDIIEEISHRLEEKNISIGLDISDDIVLKKVNHSLLFQLFYNLINNAIKFNKQDGSILIRGLSLKNGGYEISVIDTGIGIADDQIPYIFDRFRKVNISENAGHGLGLAIVKSIAAYHNLEISIQSKVGKGTTLSVKSIQN